MSIWNYQDAFKRNRGLISPDEQLQLKQKHIAIAGMGGVGGEELITLVRMGFENFTIADNDTFEIANFNRQHGAMIQNVGRSKAESMAAIAASINPEVNIKIISSFITNDNVDSFFEGIDLYIDAIDAFQIRDRRVIFKKAADRQIYAVTAGPIGFSSAFLIFDPKGMGFDEYFGINDQQNDMELFCRFIVGLTPKATQRSYMDLSFVDVKEQRGPSVSAACHLSAGIVGTYAVKILLGRGPIKAVPYYHQFDPYHEVYHARKLTFGSNGPIHSFKRRKLMQYLKKLNIS